MTVHTAARGDLRLRTLIRHRSEQHFNVVYEIAGNFLWGISNSVEAAIKHSGGLPWPKFSWDGVLQIASKGMSGFGVLYGWGEGYAAATDASGPVSSEPPAVTYPYIVHQ